MKTLLRRVFSHRFPGRLFFGSHEPDPSRSAVISTLSSELTAADVENFYLRIVIDCLRRMLVPLETVEVGAKRTGTDTAGLSTYAVYLRLKRWDPATSPGLLQNLPALDARVRKVVQTSVILKRTSFGGLWLQAGSEIEGSPGAQPGAAAELARP